MPTGYLRLLWCSCYQFCPGREFAIPNAVSLCPSRPSPLFQSLSPTPRPRLFGSRLSPFFFPSPSPCLHHLPHLGPHPILNFLPHPLSLIILFFFAVTLTTLLIQGHTILITKLIVIHTEAVICCRAEISKIELTPLCLIFNF